MTDERVVRRAAVAGGFYPETTAGCLAALERLLPANHLEGPAPKALIAPHAGWVFSGPVAATAYQRIKPLADLIEKVVILCPAHTVPLTVAAVSSADAWATPLGEIAIDDGLRDAALACEGVEVDDHAHRHEHAIEVHLPFLQYVVGAFTLLPVVVGSVPSARVEQLLDQVWGGYETLIVVSSDLSHHLDNTTATEVDRRTAAAIVAADASQLSDRSACGVYALRGLLERANRHHQRIELLDLRTSADAAGSPERVVGYGAFALHETP